MFFIYPNQEDLKKLITIANCIINIVILNKDIRLIKFLYILTKMKYQTYLKFQYGYYIEIFNSFLSYLYNKFLHRKHFNWQNKSDWAHQTYKKFTNFHSRQNWVHWTHLYFLNQFTIKKPFIIPASPSSRRRIFPQE